MLDDLGLVGALRLSGPAAAPEGPTVDISSEGPLADLPAAVEVAAYRIVSEALTNAARHAGAERIDGVLRACEDALTLEVRDDGCGLPDVVAPGVGLASMQARAAELGGWCTVTPTVGGTLVTARLPGRSS